MTTRRSINDVATLVACLLAAGVHSARAAAPTHVWSERFGGAGYDIAYAAAADSFDNVYVTGVFEGQVAFGATVLTSAGNRDMFLVKLAADGSVPWAIGQGGSGNEYGLSVAVGQDGNTVFVTGTHNTFPGLTSAGANDIFIASYRGVDGTRLMAKGFGGPLGDAGQSIAITSGDGILITGYFAGSVNFGGGVLNSADPSTQDIFVAKLTSAGTHLWSRRCGGTLNDIGREVARDASGNVFVTGEFRGTADFGGSNLVSAGDSDIFLLKYDDAGNLLWRKRFGGALADAGNSLAVDRSGGVFVTGAFGGTVNFGGGNLVSAGGSDIFLAKFASTGAYLLSARYGSAGNDAGTVAAGCAGGVILGGSIQGDVNFGGGNVTASGSTDAFVARFGANGAHVWSRGMGGASDDVAQGVAVKVSGDPCVVGQFMSTANFGGADLVSAGDNDMFAACYAGGSVSAVHDTPARSALSISNYPNPFNPSTTLTYHVPARGVVTVSIHDAAGTRVATLVDHAERAPGVYTAGWDGRAAHGSAVASGVYFARIELAGAVRSTKMILLK